MKTNETKPDDMTAEQWVKYLRLLSLADRTIKETRNHEHKAAVEHHEIFLKRFVKNEIRYMW